MTTNTPSSIPERSPAERVPPQGARIVVSVGTDHHPFDRLVGWIDAWAEAHPEASVLVQRGTSTPTNNVESIDLVGHAELRREFAAADVVISHGGPSTVMDARMAGRLPIVVPRDSSLGEHVDKHQMRFADHLHRHGLARLALTQVEFDRLLDEALADPDAFTIPRPDTGAPPGVVHFGAVVDDLLGINTPIVQQADGTP